MDSLFFYHISILINCIIAVLPTSSLLAADRKLIFNHYFNILLYYHQASSKKDYGEKSGI
jgi:hypothetical protein